MKNNYGVVSQLKSAHITREIHRVGDRANNCDRGSLLTLITACSLLELF